jgi:hypothetical protein
MAKIEEGLHKLNALQVSRLEIVNGGIVALYSSPLSACTTSIHEQRVDREEEVKVEQSMREAPKPRPKFDKVTGKWVVKNWDGTVAGIPNGEQRSFDGLEETNLAVGVASTTIQDTTAAEEDAVMAESQHTIPFARINAVAAHSPANEAGLQEGDLMLEFGPINHTNHKGLMAIGELVPEVASNQEQIDVTILRNGNETVKLQLKPRPWDGRGLLGCHIVKYTPEQ